MHVLIPLLGGQVFPLALMFTAFYLGYWCFRGCRRAWYGLTGRRVPTTSSGPALGWSKGMHVAATIVSVATVCFVVFLLLILIALSNTSF
jgi:hypothetical protein